MPAEADASVPAEADALSLPGGPLPRRSSISIRYEGGVIGFTLSQPRSPDAAVTKKTPKRLRIWLGLVVFRHTLGPRTGNVMLRCVAAAILAIGVMGVALAGCSDSSSSSLLLPPTEFLQFETVPPGADVQTAGGQTCRTPCSLAMPLAAQSVSVAMNGYTPQTVALGLRQDNMFSPVVLAPNPVTVTLQAVPKPVRTPKSRKVPGRAKGRPNRPLRRQFQFRLLGRHLSRTMLPRLPRRRHHQSSRGFGLPRHKRRRHDNHARCQ